MSTFSLPGRLIVCEVRIEANCTIGTGVAEFPCLTIRADLTLRAPNDSSLYFRDLRCKVAPQTFSYAAFSVPSIINELVHSGREQKNKQIYIEIPLDNARLALFERVRNGGDFCLRLQSQLVVDELVPIQQLEEVRPQFLYAIKEHHILSDELQVHIPRSQWTSSILPQMGFGSIHLIELPTVPIHACAPLKNSYEALRKAEQLEKEGHYQESVSRCRAALEPLQEQVEKEFPNGDKRKVPVLKRSWEAKIGKATYDWLNTCLVSLKDEGNLASHQSSRVFEQSEAKMILIVTTAVVAYAIQTMPANESGSGSS